MKDILVVMINYNSSEHTLEAVKALSKQTIDSFDLVIIDNNSKDSEKKVLMGNKFDNNVEVIYAEQNYGFAGGNNIILQSKKILSYKNILLMNNDVWVDSDFLELILKGADRYPNAILCPQIIDYYNRNTILYAGGDIKKYKGAVTIWGAGEKVGTHEEDKKITFAHGCCMFIPVSVLKKIGGMREDYFLYYEDTDYSKKILDNGYDMWYLHDAKLYHKESVSTGLYSMNYQYYFSRGRLLFVKYNIEGGVKFFAYVYTFAFLIRAILEGNFTIKGCMLGVIDFFKGCVGKKKIV